MHHTAATEAMLTHFGAVYTGVVRSSRLTPDGPRYLCAARFPKDICWSRLHEAEAWLACHGFAGRVEFPNEHPVLYWTMPVESQVLT